MDNSENCIENKYKNDLFIIFLDKLITLYNEREYDRIRNILIGDKCEIKKHKYVYKNGCSKYYDNDSIIITRIWTDNETKKLLDVLYYVCIDENVTISLNNKLIEFWLYTLNSEMSKFFYDTSNKITIECNENYRLSFKIQRQIWSDFVKKCKTLGITVSMGFKNCVNGYLEQESNIHL